MARGLDLLAAAFAAKRPRIAVFDRDHRTAVGQWRLAEPVDVPEIVEHLARQPAFRIGEAVVLPLHEPDSAEVTGEYLLYFPAAGGRRVGFYDFSIGGLASSPIEAVGRYRPAHQLRFWHPAVEPPRVPSFVAEADLSGRSLSGRRAAPVAPEPAEDRDFFAAARAAVDRLQSDRRASIRDRFRRMETRSFIAEYGGLDRLGPGGRHLDGDEQVCRLDLAGVPDGTDRGWLRAGVDVVVDAIDAEGFPVEATVRAVDDAGVDLDVRWSTAADHGAAEAAFGTDSDVTFRLGALLDPRPFERYREGIDAVEADPRKRSILAGDRPLRFDEVDSETLVRRGLDEFQSTAVENAVAAELVCCVRGAPATGKTRVLASVVANALRREDRVLVTAAAPAGVDGLLAGASTADRADPRSLHGLLADSRFDVARVGPTDHPLIEDRYAGREPWEATVVAAGIEDTHRFRPDEFDLVVVDDAHRAAIPATLLAFSRGRRLVLAGDVAQPPPAEWRSATGSGLEPSLLERFVTRYGEGVSTTLRRQYRMNAAIGDLLDAVFYDGQLLHGQGNRDRTVRDLPPVEAVHVDGREGATPGGSAFNEPEAAVAAAEVRATLRRGVPAGRIGVITTTSGQVGKIAQAIDAPDIVDAVEISPMDSVAAGVRDAIVVSFVRTAPDPDFAAIRDAGRWLNFAISRARRRCVLVGDWEALGAADPSAPDATALDRLHRYLREHDLVRPADG